MCKVTIKKVEKIKKPVTGNTDGTGWMLHIMECVVSVDGSKEGVRTVKTFEDSIAQQVAKLEEGSELVFEATKKPAGSVYEYTLKLPKSSFRNRGGRNASEPFGPTNRQAALRYAVELERAQSATCDEIPTPAMILETAEKFLSWLEQRDVASTEGRS